MKFFSSTNIDFIRGRKITLLVSALLIAATVAAYIYRGGPNYGIDFTGGISMQISFDKTVALDDVRSSLDKANIGSFDLQSSGQVVIIIAKQKMNDQHAFEAAVLNALTAKFPNNTLKVDGIEFVGPSVGAEIAKGSMKGFIGAFLLMILYIAFRFKSSVWGIAGVLGIIHDVIIVTGTVLIVNKEINITVIAGLLTVAGYSINDKIVLFDRMRENLRLSAKEDFATILNKSINQVILRTVVTSSTVFFVAASLFFFGGEVLHTFAYIMLIGTMLGVYSSIFVCAPMIYEWETRKRKRMKAAGIK